ncbi:hypothetical protein V502_01361 [Pseudogymnoascus sp. VKM F-4520 (FW-2644)]|nr:hypothetical protein V502_01361 [Pseudogymnoascus sp. VKM F-4520 (FW-2644)]
MSMESTPGASSNPILISRAPVGITEPYQGNSLTVKSLIVFGTGLAMYNALELIILAFGTFKRHNSVYFWSFLISSIGILPYSIGLLFKSLGILRAINSSYRWVTLVLITIGWYAMVTGQSLVLWSRLHLIVSGDRGQKILQYTKWMIIINSIILFIPTTVVEFGSFGNRNTTSFATAYNIMEKIQITGFFIQEVILSSIYIVEATKILHTSLHRNTRGLMRQLLLINVVVIIMDIGLLGMEYASLFLVQAITKGFVEEEEMLLEDDGDLGRPSMPSLGEGSGRRHKNGPGRDAGDVAPFYNVWDSSRNADSYEAAEDYGGPDSRPRRGKSDPFGSEQGLVNSPGVTDGYCGGVEVIPSRADKNKDGHCLWDIYTPALNSESSDKPNAQRSNDTSNGHSLHLRSVAACGWLPTVSITWEVMIMFYISYGTAGINGAAAFRIPWGLQMIAAFLYQRYYRHLSLSCSLPKSEV